VSSGLDSLCNDNIAAGVTCGTGFISGADLPTGQGAASMRDLDEARLGPSPEELDQTAPVGGILQGEAVEERQEETDTDGHPTGMASSCDDRASCPMVPVSMPSPPACGTAMARSGR